MSTTSPCESSPPAQAGDLYELITERNGRSLVLTPNRAPQVLDRSSNNSHQLFTDGDSYRMRRARREEETPWPRNNQP